MYPPRPPRVINARNFTRTESIKRDRLGARVCVRDIACPRTSALHSDVRARFARASAWRVVPDCVRHVAPAIPERVGDTLLLLRFCKTTFADVSPGFVRPTVPASRSFLKLSLSLSLCANERASRANNCAMSAGVCWLALPRLRRPSSRNFWASIIERLIN